MDFLKTLALPVSIFLSVAIYSSVVFQTRKLSVQKIEGFHPHIELWSLARGDTSCFYVNNQELKKEKLSGKSDTPEAHDDINIYKTMPDYMIFCKQ